MGLPFQLCSMRPEPTEMGRYQLIAFPLCLAACTMSDDADRTMAAKDSFRSPSNRSSIEQIGEQSADGLSSFSPAQINPSGDDRLTTEQLRAFVDRCAPGASEPAASDDFCDELRLRIEPQFETRGDLERAIMVLQDLIRSGDSLDRAALNGTMLLPPDLLQPEPQVPQQTDEELLGIEDQPIDLPIELLVPDA